MQRTGGDAKVLDSAAFGDRATALSGKAVVPALPPASPLKSASRRLRSTSFSSPRHKEHESSDDDEVDLELKALAARDRWNALFAAQRAPATPQRSPAAQSKSVRPGHVRRASTNSIADLLQATKLDDMASVQRDVFSDHEGDRERAFVSRISYPSRTVQSDDQAHVEPASVVRRPSFRVRTNLFLKLPSQSSAKPPTQKRSAPSLPDAPAAQLSSLPQLIHPQHKATLPTTPRQSHKHRRKRSSTMIEEKKPSSNARAFFDSLMRNKKSAQSLRKSRTPSKSVDITSRNSQATSSKGQDGVIHITSRSGRLQTAPGPTTAVATNLPLNEFGQNATTTLADRPCSPQAFSSGKSDASSTFTIQSDPASSNQAGFLSLPAAPTYRRFSEESSRSNISSSLSDSRRMPLSTKLSSSPGSRTGLISQSNASPPSVYSTALRPPPRPSMGSLSSRERRDLRRRLLCSRQVRQPNQFERTRFDNR
ncbi:hypothetical protein ACM66B_002048 [Microbotryomycetes sp. NB124-2]